MAALIPHDRKLVLETGAEYYGYGFGGECPERLDACALALWAARTTKRDPRRRGRIG